MATVKDVTIRIKVDDKGVVQLDDTFDQVNKTAKKTETTMTKLNKTIAGVGGALVGAFAIKQLVTDAVQTIKLFDQAIADLGAITGATGKDLDAFKKQVLSVSQITGKGASEIAKAFQLVGSAQPELLKSAAALGEVTKQAVLLAQAGGLEVPAAAEALTKSMNQFGASAKDAAMFTDILATSQQLGTATIEQLSESLKNVGSVAASAGLSFEDTNIALQAMAKGGLVGAEAGTGLRAVILKLQNAGIGFVDGQFDLHAALKETKTKFEGINDPIKRVQEQTKLFGAENIKNGNTLIAQIGVFDELDGKLNDFGNAQEQATTRTETINGKIEKLTSTYERFILSIEDGDSVLSDVFKGALEGLDNLLSGVTELLTFDFDRPIEGLDSYLKALTGVDFEIDKVGQSVGILDAAFSRLSISELQTKENAQKIAQAYLEAGLSTEQAREKYIELGVAANGLNVSTSENTETTDEDTEATNKNTQSKKDQKTAIDAIKESFKELKAVADDNAEADEDDNNSDFMKSVGLDDKSMEDYAKKLEERQTVTDDARVKDIESKIEQDELSLEQEQAIADSKMLIDQEVKENKLNAAFAIAGAASGLIKNQLASLAVEKGIAIAQTIIMGNVAATAALAPPPIGAGPILGVPIAAGIKTNALISAATIAATAIPQIKKLKDGEVLISGDGTETSDSIPAMLSKNESIINAKSSRKHTAALKAINNDNFDAYLDRVVMQRLYMGQGNKKAQSINSKSESIEFPKGFAVKNAKAISKPIVEAIEESNFLNGVGWQ